MTNEETNRVIMDETGKGNNKKTRNLAIVITVGIAVVLGIFFFAPIVPVTGHCFAVPLNVLFSPSAMLSNYHVGAFYVENTNSYGVAPFSNTPTVGYCY
jgi:hypothetical protein